MWNTPVHACVRACEQLLGRTRGLQQEGQWLDLRGHFWIARECVEPQEQERRAPGVGEEAGCRERELAAGRALCQAACPV